MGNQTLRVSTQLPVIRPNGSRYQFGPSCACLAQSRHDCGLEAKTWQEGKYLLTDLRRALEIQAMQKDKPRSPLGRSLRRILDAAFVPAVKLRASLASFA